MINESLKDKLRQKIEDGEFSAADIPAFLSLFCEIGDEVSDIQDVVEGWNRRIYLALTGLGDFWLEIEDGNFIMGEGTIANPHLTLTMDGDDAALIFSGDKDAQGAFMAGEIKVEGELPDALKMQSLIDLVIEEIEY